MPIIQVNLIEGRPSEKIKALIENITDTVSETLDAPRESVRVLVTELPKTIGELQEYQLQRENSEKAWRF